jgi:pimeloyl-ACP methyl ester carboxylesterase
VAFFTSPDRVKLSYEVVGGGPPLVMHLGAGCDSGLWQAAGYLEPLSARYACVLFDHRGHGQSDRPRGAEAHHIDRYADDVVALLDHLGIGAAGFWGYSNGISVGIKVADDHPGRLLALVGTGGTDDATPEQLAEIRARRVPEYREHGWETLIARFDAHEPEPVPEWMKQRIRDTDIEQFIGWIEARPAWGWSDWKALARIPIPTLFIVGEHEDPEDEMAEAAELMSDGKRVRIEGQGHINAFLRSDLVLPYVLEFLGRTVAGSGEHDQNPAPSSTEGGALTSGWEA